MLLITCCFLALGLGRSTGAAGGRGVRGGRGKPKQVFNTAGQRRRF